MKVYMVSEGKPNSGYGCSIKAICATLKLAEHLQEAFKEYGLTITEFDVME